MTRPAVDLKQLELGPMQNFVYLIGDPATRQAAVVDPGWDVPTILSTAQEGGYQISHILVTHAHFDHVMGLGELLSAVDVPVYVNRDEAASLDLPRSNLRMAEPDEVVAVGQASVKLLHTPGHTRGSQCLLVGDRLLTGDTLFVRACGRCDLPGGDPVALYHSLAKLKQLDEQIIVCPGHHYAEVPTSTIGQEKRDNPFLQPASLDDFLTLLGVPHR